MAASSVGGPAHVGCAGRHWKQDKLAGDSLSGHATQRTRRAPTAIRGLSTNVPGGTELPQPARPQGAQGGHRRDKTTRSQRQA